MRKWFRTVFTSALALVMFSGCAIGGIGNNSNSENSSINEDDGTYTVSFDLCTDLETNTVEAQEVEAGDIATKPSVGVIGDNPYRMEIEAWYTEADYKTKWNFLIDTVESDMTLYAKWVKKFAVNYYLGDNLDAPMYTQYLKEGEIITARDDLSDGYESEGFFSNAAYTKEFEFGKPITADVNIYIDRSDYIYFDGGMIANRFSMCAAPSGPGSLAGTLEEVTTEEGESYAKMNFGYSTASDPYALLENVTVDISKSQKLEITMKNMGSSRSLKLYFVSWLPDGTLVDAPHFNEKSAVLYEFKDTEKNMKPEDEWITITVDMAAESINDGVSYWGISATMIKLRLQSGYTSTDEKDLSNEFWIKSIKGVADKTYTSTEDSEAITQLRTHDDATEVKQIADAQVPVAGWVFPKDFENATASSSEIYDKKEGLLFYSAYRAKESRVSFTLDKDETISLDELTTIKLRLRNYGHANSLKIEYTNKQGFTVSQAVSIDTQSEEVVEYELNMFGAPRYTGELYAFGIVYDSVGLDNAILIESIEFSEFKLSEVAGFNLNDKFAGQENNLYWTETEGVEVSHNGGGLENGATVVTVNTDSASLVKSSIRMTTVGYEKISLTYKLAEAGISKVYVGLTIGVEETIYTFEVAVGEEFQTIEVPVTASGDASKLTISFEGTGAIELQSIRFIMNAANGLDFSVSEQFDYMARWKWDNGVVAYNVAKASVDLVARNANTATGIYYFCNMLKDFKYGSGNIDLTNKSKIVVIYNNMSEVAKIRIAIGLVDVTEGDEWKTAHIEPYSDGSGKAQDVEIETGMAEGEWTALEIDLTIFNTLGGENGTAGRAVNCITFQQLNPNSVDTVNIRAIMFV